MVLGNVNPTHVKKDLPKRMMTYVKVYLIHMMVQTNDFMARIYNSPIQSDEVFQQAQNRSGEISGQWHQIQSQITLLKNMMTTYFSQVRNLPSDSEYYSVTDKLNVVNRNILHMSVFPNMVIMNYYMNKLKGKVKFTFFGFLFEKDANIVIDDFFDYGESTTWFTFAKDPEPLPRPMLIYAWDSMLSSEALNAFTAKDSDATGVKSDRGRFFDLIYSNYLEDDINVLTNDVNKYEATIINSSAFHNIKQVCDYELHPADGRYPTPDVNININDVMTYTYFGISTTGLNKSMQDIYKNVDMSIDKMIGAKGVTDDVDRRMTLAKVLLEVTESHLLRDGAIKFKGQDHEDTRKIRSLIDRLDALKFRVANAFLSRNKYIFDCTLKTREIERRRMYRLFQEEEDHLGLIYDSLQKISQTPEGSARNAKIAHFNEYFFKHTEAAQPGDPESTFTYPTDHIEGLSYMMHKYDLLVRMQARINDDIFAKPKARSNAVGALNEVDEFAKDDYYRPRPVTVSIHPGIDQENYVTNRKPNPIRFDASLTREEFIRHGMQSLIGSAASQDPYLLWATEIEQDYSFMADYMDALLSFYLAGAVQDPKSENALYVSPREVVDSYIRSIAVFGMDKFDLHYGKEFPHDSRSTFFTDKLFEADGTTRRPFFSYLMGAASDKANLSLNGTGPVGEAYRMARSINNIGLFIFEPSNDIPTFVRKHYGDSVSLRLTAVTRLYKEILARDKLENPFGDYATRLALPIMIFDNKEVHWHDSSLAKDPLVDTVKLEDQKNLIEKFTSGTTDVGGHDFYNSRARLEAP
jgi:hypothetical protein